jgi:hypothetical protein
MGGHAVQLVPVAERPGRAPSALCRCSTTRVSTTGTGTG